MSTSSQRESTDSIDDEHSSERAANDSIVYTIFNLLISFSLHFVCFSQLKADICSVVRSFFWKRKKKRYLFMPWLKRWITVFQFFIERSFFLIFFFNQIFQSGCCDLHSCVCL